MTRSTRARWALAAAALTLAACDSKKGEYARDGDSGAAAPATRIDTTRTPGAPDSTTGVSQPSGGPAIAGDSTGRRNQNDQPRTPPASGTKTKTPPARP
jgi:hypothetical protein